MMAHEFSVTPAIGSITSRNSFASALFCTWMSAGWQKSTAARSAIRQQSPPHIRSSGTTHESRKDELQSTSKCADCQREVLPPNFGRLSVYPDHSSPLFPVHVLTRRHAVTACGVMSGTRLYSSLSNKPKDNFDSQQFSPSVRNPPSRLEYKYPVLKAPQQRTTPTRDQIPETKSVSLSQPVVKKEGGEGRGRGAEKRRATVVPPETNHEPILVKDKKPRSSRRKKKEVTPIALPAESAEGQRSLPLESETTPPLLLTSSKKDLHPLAHTHPSPPLLPLAPTGRSEEGSTTSLSSTKHLRGPRGREFADGRSAVSGIVAAPSLSPTPTPSPSPTVQTASLSKLKEPRARGRGKFLKAQKEGAQLREVDEERERIVRYLRPDPNGKTLQILTKETAKGVVQMLMSAKYRHLVFACDTEVADIDPKRMSPVCHGRVICFSIYFGEEVEWGGERFTKVWVDTMGDRRGRREELLQVFRAFFEDGGIKKVWHNYSFDAHVLSRRYGILCDGFYADTMHMARLFDTGRRDGGGYSLETLSSTADLIGGGKEMVWTSEQTLEPKRSMKELFGRKKMTKGGKEGKQVVLPPVDEIQSDEALRPTWIDYSSHDAVCTFVLFWSLHSKLREMPWHSKDTGESGCMMDFYERYWRPFGEVLVGMEREGMELDTGHLKEMEVKAREQQHNATEYFRKWAEQRVADAHFMNVASDSQIQQLLFAGAKKKRRIDMEPDEPDEYVPEERLFKVRNVEGVIEDGKKVAKKTRNIVLRGLGVTIPVEQYTTKGAPAVTQAVLAGLAGKIKFDLDQTFVESEDSNSEEEGEGEEGVGEGISDLGLDLSPDLALPLWEDSGAVPSDPTTVALDGDLDVDVGVASNLSEEQPQALPPPPPLPSPVSIAEATEEHVSMYGKAYAAFGGGEEGKEACRALSALVEVGSINSLLTNFLLPLQGSDIRGPAQRVHCSLNINTETGRLSARKPSLQNQPSVVKDRYHIRKAFRTRPGNVLVVADYGQLELRVLAHLARCKSMIEAFRLGGDFHSRTALNMYPHIREAVERGEVLLEGGVEGQEGVPLLKDKYKAERQKAKMLNFSIAYGKTAMGLAKDWKVTTKEADSTVALWYSDRQEVLTWQQEMKQLARETGRVHTILGRPRDLKGIRSPDFRVSRHYERAAINTPVQGSAADIAMLAMLKIDRNEELRGLGYKLVLQVHDEVILEGPLEEVERAQELVVECMAHPFDNVELLVELVVDANHGPTWYEAK